MVEDRFVVAGGEDLKFTESCEVKNGTFHCTDQPAMLNNFFVYPLLTLINNDDYDTC